VIPPFLFYSFGRKLPAAEHMFSLIGELEPFFGTVFENFFQKNEKCFGGAS
jgi:hypothetical protein